LNPSFFIFVINEFVNPNPFRGEKAGEGGWSLFETGARGDGSGCVNILNNNYFEGY